MTQDSAVAECSAKQPDVDVMVDPTHVAKDWYTLATQCWYTQPPYTDFSKSLLIIQQDVCEMHDVRFGR